MRLILFTGKGGVGKTTVAAATATVVAARGHKVLLASTDTAHSLADTLGVALTSEPAEIDGGLSAVHVDPQARFEQNWTVLRRYLVELLGSGGVGSVAAEELTVLPGLQEILALGAVREQAMSGRWDAIVVDCAPTAETLRLLSLPRALQWYLERALPTHRRMVHGLGPLRNGLGPLRNGLGPLRNGLGPLLGGITVPGDGVVDAVSRLHATLLGVQEVLDDPGTSVRLVLTPEAVVLAEARRTATSLALFGHRLDAVVVNRLIPAGDDPWRAAWATAQAEQLGEVRSCFPGLPLHEAAYRSAEPVGPVALAELGEELYGKADPLAAGPPESLFEVRRPESTDGERYELVVALPHAEPGEVDLVRSGDDLAVTVGGYRRLLALPGVLRRCQAERADLTEGRLVVTFGPDPALWPPTPTVQQ